MTTQDDDKEAFLSRWSRLKRETKEQPPQQAPEKVPEKAVDLKAAPPELPPVDKLTLDSDFRPFFNSKVDEDVRRAALKKLFSDPHFNVMDGLDVYIDDYSKSEPIPAAMLASLRQAQNILKWAKGEEVQEKDTALASAKPEPAATAPAAALEQQISPVTPSLGSGEQAAENVPAAPDQKPSRRSPENS